MGCWKQFEDNLWLFAIRFTIDDNVFRRDIKIKLFFAPKSKCIWFLKPGLKLTLSIVEISEHGHHQISSLLYYKMTKISKQTSLLLLTILGTQCIQITMMKQNIFVPNDTQYVYKLSVQETDNSLNPFSNITLRNEITNTITTKAQYFDYFSYISSSDLACYKDAVGNKSYLYPCSFILSIYLLKQTTIKMFALISATSPLTLKHIEDWTTTVITLLLTTLHSPFPKALILTQISLYLFQPFCRFLSKMNIKFLE